jgi:ankyrin repeat protein
MARDGDTATLAAFLDAGVPVTLTNTNGDHFRDVGGLLRTGGGADVDRHNNRGQTPLAGAVFKNETTIMELLLRAGADPLAGSPSALEKARFFGRVHIAQQLEQHIERRRTAKQADSLNVVRSQYSR